tara:strand:- start:649 stop:897 length:249 start_codon:yes stop_codon:yes gene_type:complete
MSLSKKNKADLLQIAMAISKVAHRLESFNDFLKSNSVPPTFEEDIVALGAATVLLMIVADDKPCDCNECVMARQFPASAESN